MGRIWRGTAPRSSTNLLLVAPDEELLRTAAAAVQFAPSQRIVCGSRDR